jgi:hypothetical protein
MIVKEGQNIYDVCVSGTGDINNLFGLTRLNKIDIDFTAASGQELIKPTEIQKRENYITTTNYTETLKNFKQIFDGQNIFDITCMYFGDISYLFTPVSDNSISISDRLVSGNYLLINNRNVGNESIKNMVVNGNLIFNNYQTQSVQEVTIGDYNNDYGNDHL